MSKDTKESNGRLEILSVKPVEIVIPTGSKLVAFLDSLTPEDLEGLRNEIQNTGNRLKGLKRLERVASAALGEEEKRPNIRKKRAAATTTGVAAGDPATAMLQKRKQIVKFLQEGAKTGPEIIRHCGVHVGNMEETMNHAWFTKSVHGYHVTAQARRDCGQ